MKQDSTIFWLTRFSTRLQLFLSYSFSYSNLHTNKKGGNLIDKIRKLLIKKFGHDSKKIGKQKLSANQILETLISNKIQILLDLWSRSLDSFELVQSRATFVSRPSIVEILIERLRLPSSIIVMHSLRSCSLDKRRQS